MLDSLTCLQCIVVSSVASFLLIWAAFRACQGIQEDEA